MDIKNKMCGYMIRVMVTCLGLSVVAAGPTVQAQVSEPESAPTWPSGSPPEGWRPGIYNSSSWFDPARSGSGWALSRLPSLPGESVPFYAGTVYTYDTDGRPYWLLMSGNWQPASWQTFFATNEIGRFSGTLVDGRSGACPVCAYAPPVVEPSPYGVGTVVFKGNGAHAEVLMDGVLSETIRPSEVNLWKSVEDLLVGRWRFQTYDGMAGQIYFNGLNETLERLAAPPAWMGNLQTLNGDVLRVPSLENSVFYRYAEIPPTQGVVVFDKTDGTILGYRFTQGQEINESGQRVGYRMSENDGLIRYVLLDDRTMVRIGARNTRDVLTAPSIPTEATRLIKD